MNQGIRPRLTRLALALLLLALVWPAVAHLVAFVLVGTIALAVGHPTLLCTIAAAVLLLGTIPGPVDRALTRMCARQLAEITGR